MGTLRLTAITSDDMAKMPWDDGSDKLINVHSKPRRWRRHTAPSSGRAEIGVIKLRTRHTSRELVRNGPPSATGRRWLRRKRNDDA